LHKLFGNFGQEILNKKIKMYGFKSYGSFDTYWLGSSNFPDECLYVDVSLIKERSFGGAKFWALIVDDYTDYYWSFVMKNKSDIKARIKTLLTDLNIVNWIGTFIRCHNAGENITMKNDPEIKSFGINLNFRALELFKKMERLRESFKHFMEQSGQC
jgi:hypothetical protein